MNRLSILGLCSLVASAAFTLSSCGENMPIGVPLVVDAAGSGDVADDVTPTADTGLPDDAMPEDALPDGGGDGASGDGGAGGCTYSSDCPGVGDVCLAGKCVAQTVCASDKQCQSAGQVCDTAAGVCVQCLGDVDCAKGQQCKAHKCLDPATPCTTTKECATGLVCDKSVGACVECATGADCNPGLACQETLCVPMACKPGAVQCTSTTSLKTCAADGSAWVVGACSGDKTCLVDACVPVICAAGQKSCDGAGKVVVCNATGTALSPAETCADKTVCLAGACVPTNCTPGQKQCADVKTLAVCRADGTGYDNQTCANGLACDGGACVSTICPPNTKLCTGTKVQTCNASGTGVTLVEDCATTAQICVNGACQPTICAAGSTKCTGSTLSTCTSDGMGWTDKVCNDGDACTTDTCDPTAGCTTKAVGCDDANACTTDACDKGKGCTHVNAPGACNTGDACTGAGQCLGGTCSASPVGTVGTIAGSGTKGYLDGPGSSAQFNTPIGLAVTTNGSILVTDAGNHRIRLVAPDGSVSTFAGSGTAGGQNGPKVSAQFNGPYGLLIGKDGVIYVSENPGNRIRTIALDGTVSTLAGSGTAGYADAKGTAASFSGLEYMTLSPTGDILVADYYNNAIRRVTPTGDVATLLGGKGGGGIDGPVAIATISSPIGLAYDPAGNLYVSELFGQRVRKLDVNGMVSVLLGNGTAGFSEKPGAAGQVNKPVGLLWMPAGFLLLGEETNQRVRAIWPDGTNQTVAGDGTAGYLDGPGNKAKFSMPECLAQLPDGTVAIVDRANNRIRSLTLPVLTCNDTNPCTIDACDATAKKCTHTPAPQATACEDGNKCTSDSTCDSLGKCVGGKAITCDDSQACTDDSCDLISGKCLHGFNASACEDNNPCTTGTTCNAGGCGLPVFCDDGNPCTADSCSGGNCSHVAIANCCGTDAACDDGDGCTTDTCALTCDGTVYGGSCYKGVYANNTWTTAEQDCVSWGGHLASIGSAGENATVFATIGAACPSAQHAFVGLADSAVEGQYTWSDGSPFSYSNWASTQPDNNVSGQCAATGEDIVEMYQNGVWNDFCTSGYFACAVCEKPLPPGTCSHKAVPICCKADKDCDDGDACTSDSCIPGSPNKCTHAAITGGSCCNPIVWSADFEDGSTHGLVSSSSSTVKWQAWNGSGKAQSGSWVLYYGNVAAQSYETAGTVNSGSWTFYTPLPAGTKLTLKFKIYPDIEPDAGVDELKLSAQSIEIWSKSSGGINFKSWNNVALDVSALAGNANATFKLDFGTLDKYVNSGLGILIDDVQITRTCP